MSFYKYITEKRKDSPELKKTMEAVTKDLIKYKTDELKPGILLGLIQSGKTRAFVGVIAKGFDDGFDVAIVFTKNSVALVEQTMKRLKSEFEMPIERNKLYVWDVIKLQGTQQLTGYVLSNKIILVVKKESKNLEKLHEVFKNPILKTKKVLIVDDEADMASVSFVADKSKEEGIDYAKVAASISKLRNNLKGNNSFLQVTATPYSLYLQPEEGNINKDEYAPLRPAFTHLLEPHPYYIGGKYYFEESLNSSSPASYIHVQVSEDELGLLNGKSKTKDSYNKKLIDNILKTKALEKYRLAIYNFLVGGAIRQIQEKGDDFWAKPYHCAFVLHTSTTKQIHLMQKNLTEDLILTLAKLKSKELNAIFLDSYNNLSLSIKASKTILPKYQLIIDAIYNALQNNNVGVVEINSENQVTELLGEDGQLRLDNPFNIFVGGQSLDRGITIDHLIGFFYGRSPGTFQMDTVLQHSRMYGSRSHEDLAVTRFYASARVYEAMRNMHWFDNDLRENITKNIKTATAHFIAKQGGTIIPAGPNKLRASSLLSFKAFSRILPVGFQTRSNTDVKPIIAVIDKIIVAKKDPKKPDFLVSKKEAISIIENIRNTFAYEHQYGNVGLEWDIDPFIKALEIALDKNNTNNVIIYYQENREASRFKNSGNSFGDAPDDGKTDSKNAKQLAKRGPVLMLLKQNGKKTSGWRDAPFYWPVLMMPENMPNYVYCESK
jgi:hypothetical protein